MTEENAFVREEALRHGINTESRIYKYLRKKTKAVNRDSKSRRSFGNLYALYVLCSEYLAGNVEGSTFTHLMDLMNNMRFGSGLQNHPLDNRLNDEFKRQKPLGIPIDMLPVQHAELNDNRKARKISIPLLSEYGMLPLETAKFVVATIDRYIQIIYDNQTAYLREIEQTATPDEVVAVVGQAFQPNSDARLFEIVSFALLYLYFYEQEITFTYQGQTTVSRLTLYRTGRTNANDGGIDFVLQPFGKFFQVTETLDFNKYFLDFDKMNRYRISFVIKTTSTPDQVKTKIRTDALTSLPPEVVNIYMNLFDDIYTLNELSPILTWISNSDVHIASLKNLIIGSFKLEFGISDE